MLSPILFILVIDELAREIKRSGKGTRLGNLRISILMFADDIVLITENPEDLQYLLDVAYTFSRRWGFKLNVKKSNMVRFGRDKKEGLSWCSRA